MVLEGPLTFDKIENIIQVVKLNKKEPEEPFPIAREDPLIVEEEKVQESNNQDNRRISFQDVLPGQDPRILIPR